ncbi:MAG: DUF2442 domain-containing protein [Bacteroidetes bacterium]|nr:DUF2442 domain-containing protein [Bacteroidota bacterium]
MRIFEEYMNYGSELIKIDSAKYIGDYAIRIQFNDGKEKLVDFKPFLSKSLHPSINKYLTEKLFTKYQIIDGNLNWNDYDLIFPIQDLYNGRIEA